MVNDGVLWLHYATKCIDHDVGLDTELTYIASVFRYYSVAEIQKQQQVSD